MSQYLDVVSQYLDVQGIIAFPCGFLQLLLYSSSFGKMATIVRVFTLLALFLVLGLSNAFVPANQPGSAARSVTNLNFGFLKELGLEKPSWLPDFGGKKTEDEPEPAAVAEGDDEAEEEAEAPAEE